MSDINPISITSPGPKSPYNYEGVEKATRDLLIAIGEDPDRPGLIDTPARVARGYAEIFGGLHKTPEEVLTTTFDLGHDELVIVKDINFNSMCEHHLLPFYGHAHIGYIPNENGRITGLSKLARVTDVFAQRPQVQERLTGQIADSVMNILQPRGAIVILEAEHMCMSLRGVRKPGAVTTTSVVRGSLRDAVTRSEAMTLITGL
jgi:GTP cyclohydrolase IA